MSKFNIGDRVDTTGDYTFSPGGKGTITTKRGDEWGVLLDNDPYEDSTAWGFGEEEMTLLHPEVKVGDRVEFVECRKNYANLIGRKGVVTGEDRYSLHVTLDGDTFYRVAWKDELKVLPVEVPVVKKAEPRPSVAKARLYPSAKIILKHLQARQTISPMEALASYGCMRLAARIHDLRCAGLRISTELHRDHAGHPYARYTLHNAA